MLDFKKQINFFKNKLSIAKTNLVNFFLVFLCFNILKFQKVN